MSDNLEESADINSFPVRPEPVEGFRKKEKITHKLRMQSLAMTQAH